MAIPDYQLIMRPLLEVIQNGKEFQMKDLQHKLSAYFELTESELEELLPSGQQTVFHNRIGWAKTHLKAAGLVENLQRGIIKITPAGIDFLKNHTGEIKSRDLESIKSYLDFKNSSKASKVENAVTIVEKETGPAQTPHEQMEAAYVVSRHTTVMELLHRLKSCSPAFFERVVVELLMKMGYGGIAGKGEVTRLSNDGGIDGIINQDKLGLDVVSIQAKRWENPVGRPIVQGFVGSMDYIRAKKGVIITTSNFTKEAEDYVEKIEGKKVVLIDGKELADLMIDHNLGVVVKSYYELKEVSNDFFEED